MSFFTRLWARLNRIQAPIQPETSIFGPAVTPGLKSERFTEAGMHTEQRRQAERKATIGRIIEINNANVVRDYGSHVEDSSYAVRGLSNDEAARVDTVLAATYHDDGLTRDMRARMYANSRSAREAAANQDDDILDDVVVPVAVSIIDPVAAYDAAV